MKWTLIILIAVPLVIILVLSMLFPREMSAVFTLQSASMVKGSGVAIATRLGLGFLGGPLGWFLIIVTALGLFIKGQQLQAVTEWVRGGKTATGVQRTVLLVWQLIPISWPISLAFGIVGDLITLKLFHIPLVPIEILRAAYEAANELRGGPKSGYL